MQRCRTAPRTPIHAKAGGTLPAMQRATYLVDPHVRSFLAWAAPLVSGTRPLRQHWHSPKWGSRSFETLVDAYRAYDWPFTCVLPGDSTPRRR